MAPQSLTTIEEAMEFASEAISRGEIQVGKEALSWVLQPIQPPGCGWRAALRMNPRSRIATAEYQADGSTNLSRIVDSTPHSSAIRLNQTTPEFPGVNYFNFIGTQTHQTLTKTVQSPPLVDP